MVDLIAYLDYLLDNELSPALFYNIKKHIDDETILDSMTRKNAITIQIVYVSVDLSVLDIDISVFFIEKFCNYVLIQ